MNCQHIEVEPIILFGGDLLGQMCTHCFEALPASWGCSECEWMVAETLFGDRYVFLGAPCEAHNEQVLK